MTKEPSFWWAQRQLQMHFVVDSRAMVAMPLLFMQARRKSNMRQAWIGSRTSIPNCLIATDVISHGIDILNVPHVINFEFTHQIGCTGCAGKTDVATTP